MYEIIQSRQAEKQLDRISEADFLRVDKAIQSLKVNPRPRGVKKLHEKLHRIRVGRFRIIYVIDDKDKVVLVSHIEPRTERTYRRLP